MYSSRFLAVVLPSLLALTPSTAASTCRNLTLSRFGLGQDDSSQYSNANLTPLETVNCPLTNETCTVPRGTYNIDIYRTLNISVTSEDEEAIFKLAQQAWEEENSSPQSSEIVTDSTSTLENNEPWIDLSQKIDTTNRADYSSTFFETRGGLNYTLFFLSFTRYGQGTLSGCDNETLNGVSVRFAAPYEVLNEKKGNVSEVAGTLYGSGRNMTLAADNAAGRLVGGRRVIELVGLMSLVALLL